MGLEADCKVRFGKRAGHGKARLEAKALHFRSGDEALRLEIPHAELKSAEARCGVLAVKFSGGSAFFELGEQAEKWARKIRYPRGRLEKLGVKPGMKVAIVRLPDAAFRKELAARTSSISDGKAPPGREMIFFGAAAKADLAPLAALRERMAPAGAIWVVWPKGRRELREDDVRAAALATGLVDVKVCAFSETHSALKLVIPRKNRN